VLVLPVGRLAWTLPAGEPINCKADGPGFGPEGGPCIGFALFSMLNDPNLNGLNALPSGMLSTSEERLPARLRLFQQSLRASLRL